MNTIKKHQVFFNCIHSWASDIMYTQQCLSTCCIGGTSIGDTLATGIQVTAGPCKLMNIAI